MSNESEEHDELTSPTSRKPRRTAEPPDGGFGWIIVLAAVFNSAFPAGLDKSVSLIYKDLTKSLGFDRIDMEWMVSLQLGIKTLIGPPVGALCYVYGHRKIALIGSVINAVGLLLSSFPISGAYLILTRGLLSGLGQGFILIPTFVMPSLYFVKKKGRAVGIASLGLSLGYMIFPILTEKCLEEYRYRGTMLIISAITFNHLAFSALYRPLDLTPQSKKPSKDLEKKRESLPEKDTSDLTSDLVRADGVSSENEAGPSAPSRRKNLTESLRKKLEMIAYITGIHLLKKPVMLALCLVSVAYCFLTAIGNTFIAKLEIDIETKEVALILTLSGITDGIGRFLSGFIYDIRRVRPMRILVHALTALVTGAGFILMGLFATGFTSLLIIMLLTTMLQSSLIAQLMTIVFDIVGMDSATSGIGLVTLSAGIGYFLGPIGGGALKSVSGTYKNVFIIAGIIKCVLTTVYIAVFLIDRKKRKRNEKINETQVTA